MEHVEGSLLEQINPEKAQILRITISLPFRQVDLAVGQSGHFIRPVMPPEELLDHSADPGGKATLLVTRPYGPTHPDEIAFMEGLSTYFDAAASFGRHVAEARLRVEILGDVLDRLPVGTLVLDTSSRLLVANRNAQTYLDQWPDLFIDEFGRCRAKVRAMDKMLAEAIEAASHETKGKAQKVIQLVDDGERAVRLFITPLRNRGLGATVVFIADGNQRIPQLSSAIRELYGLSAAEAQLVQGLLEGRRLDDLAKQSRVSIHTIRAQLKSVFSKTGARRQTDLVNMVLTGPASLAVSSN
ncbi:hypothetical protein CU669_20195 [Paramagnetospirillum kuznetsovii]|uniref:HTH luxR-type domain-containing protein n=2 Tax=Paramagnetospirillum kuznetsovii TaxID=2053833 RepID=A0A364NSU3_9PROT|nr:hypothetical protein CU669_20195 [Paramagnetospirillum kuznetsovii]